MNSLEDVENANLKKETIVILGLIYRDFLCDPDEKNKLKRNEQELINMEAERYSLDNLFHNKKSSINSSTGKEEIQQGLVEIREETFLLKLINKIKQFFKNLKIERSKHE